MIAGADEPAGLGDEEEVERGAGEGLVLSQGWSVAPSRIMRALTTAVTVMIVRIVDGVQTFCQISSPTIWDAPA